MNLNDITNINARLHALVIEAHQAQRMFRCNSVLTCQATLRMIAAKAKDAHDCIMAAVEREFEPPMVTPAPQAKMGDECTCPGCSEESVHHVRPLTLRVVGS